MNIPDWVVSWVPAITTTGLFAALLAFVRPFSEAIFGRAVSHRYDVRIAEINNQLRMQEAAFTQQVRAKEQEFDALRQNALAGLGARGQIIAKRRIDAIDKIWASVGAHNRFRGAIEILKVLNVDEIEKDRVLHEREYQSFFKTISQMVPDQETAKQHLKDAQCWEARPYVSDLLWAYHQLHLSIIMRAYGLMKMLEIGVDGGSKLLKDKEFVDKILEHFPSTRDAFEKFGLSFSYYVLDMIEYQMLAEIRKSVQGREESEESLRESAHLLKLSKEINPTSPDIPAV